MATIKEVARRAKVSVGTVSNVLTGAIAVSDTLKARVERAIRDLQYRPNHIARSLKTRRTKTLGMVISDITNPFYPQVVRGAEDSALRHGYMLVTFNTDDRVDREDQVLAELQARKVDGALIVTSLGRTDYRPLLALRDGGIPLVCVDRVAPALPLDSVTVTNRKGARECVRHIIECGHARIAMIAGDPRSQVGRDRLRGYKDALKSAGLPVDPALIAFGDFRQQTASEGTVKLLSLPAERRPTALFVANSMMALGVLEALETLGLACPRDIALASFDDLTLAAPFRPHLTSVAQPTYDLGYKAAELLIDRLTGKLDSPSPVRVRLDTVLHVRESTAGHRLARVSPCP